jgi:integrase
LGQFKTPYLNRRGNIFTFRMRLPVTVIRRFGQGELKFSLKTSDIGQAKFRCRLLTTAFEQLFDRLDIMPELSQDDLMAIARDYFKHLLRCENEDLYKMREIDGFNDDDIKDFAQKRSATIARFEDKLPATDTDTRDWLDKRGHSDVAKFSDSFGILEKYFGRAKLEAHKIGQAKMLGNMAGTLSVDPLYAGIMDDTHLTLEEMHARHFPRLTRNMALLGDMDEPAKTTVSNAIDKFVEFKMKQKSWSEKTEAEYKKSLDWFKEVIGADRLVATLKTSDIADFQDKLLNMPKGATQKLKTKSLKAAIAAKTEGMETLSDKAVVKYMTPIKNFLVWAVDDDLMVKVPGKNVKLKVDDGSDKRPFTREELKHIFTSSMFSGCKSLSRRSKPGDLIYKNAYYWLFLILAFTGARIGEVVLLNIQDIQQKDGVWLFDINDEELKKLKTKNSRRKVPIHDFLIAIGFLDFVKLRSGNAKTGRLFSEFTAKNPVGAFSKVGNRYLNDIGLADETVSLHSFRHTFIDACRTAEVHEPHRKQMTGHSEGGMAEVYGDGADIEALHQSINKIKWTLMDVFDPTPAGKKIINGY